MKIERPGHTLHFGGAGEKAWAESLKRFPLGVFDEEVHATAEALEEALFLTAAAFESGLKIDIEHDGVVGTYLGDSFYSSLTVALRIQIIAFQLGRGVIETDPEAAVTWLSGAYFEDAPLTLFKLITPPEPDTKEADFFRPLTEGLNILKLTWNPKVLLLMVSAQQRSAPREARQMNPQLVHLMAHDLWDELVSQEGVWASFGMLQRAVGQDESARISFRWALDENPDSYLSMLELGRSYLDAGEMETALHWVRGAEKGRSASGLQAFLLHMEILRDLGRLEEIREVIDAERHWPVEWRDFEPDWMNDVEVMETRLQLARLVGFAEATPPRSSRPASVAETPVDELVSELQGPAVRSQISADAAGDLERRRPQISASLKATLADVWQSLSTHQKNALITAEYHFQSFNESPDYSWRGVASDYFGPIEALKRRIGLKLRNLLPRTAAYEPLFVGKSPPSQVSKLPRVSMGALMFVLTDATKRSPENRVLLQLPETVRERLQRIMNVEDRRGAVRVQRIRNTIHEKEVVKDAVVELRRLVLGPERSVLRWLVAIDGALDP